MTRYGDIEREELERHRALTDELGRRREQVAEEAAERRAALGDHTGKRRKRVTRLAL